MDCGNTTLPNLHDISLCLINFTFLQSYRYYWHLHSCRSIFLCHNWR